MTFIGPSAHASIHLSAWLQSCLVTTPLSLPRLHSYTPYMRCKWRSYKPLTLQVAILQAPELSVLFPDSHEVFQYLQCHTWRRCKSPATQVRHHHLCNRNQWLSLSLWPNFNLELSFKQQLVFGSTLYTDTSLHQGNLPLL